MCKTFHDTTWQRRCRRGLPREVVTDGAKSKFVTEKYANGFTGEGNHAFCILTDKEPVRTFVCRQLTSKSGKRYDQIYKCTRLQRIFSVQLDPHTVAKETIGRFSSKGRHCGQVSRSMPNSISTVDPSKRKKHVI